MINSANASTLTFLTKDINTKQPIALANISIYNDSDNFFLSTDVYGLAHDNDLTGGHYYNITRPGYISMLDSVYVDLTTEDSNIVYYMTPISTDGIVRVIWTDDTINMPDRKMCIFYKENGRLDGCYYKNETMQLINNREFILEPQTNFWDYLTSIRSIWLNRLTLIPYIGIILICIYLFMTVLRKK